MCGIDGSAPPLCVAVIPLVVLGPIKSSADKNCEDALASIVSEPPGITPLLFITIGSE